MRRALGTPPRAANVLKARDPARQARGDVGQVHRGSRTPPLTARILPVAFDLYRL